MAEREALWDRWIDSGVPLYADRHAQCGGAHLPARLIVYVDGAATLPFGTVHYYSGETPPTGWRWLDDLTEDELAALGFTAADLNDAAKRMSFILRKEAEQVISSALVEAVTSGFGAVRVEVSSDPDAPMQMQHVAMAGVREQFPDPQDDAPSECLEGALSGLGNLGGVLAATATELRPPPEHADKLWHWVSYPGHAPAVMKWGRQDEGWWIAGQPFLHKPSDLAGYAYLSPAEWRGKEKSASSVYVHPVIAEMIRERDRRIAELEAENQRLATELADREEPVVSGEMVPYERLRAMAQDAAMWRAEADNLKAELQALKAIHGHRDAPNPIPGRALKP